MKSIEIDRGKALRDEPSTGHNRYHPEIPPILEVDEGEEVVLETRDAVDGQVAPDATVDDLSNLEVERVHPLTGPVFVKGAQPGDLLEVEFLDIVPEPRGVTAILPGFGFLRDVCTTPFLVHWSISDGWATSPQLPRVRIPGAPFMGISAVSPSHAEVGAWAQRERELTERGGVALPPDPTGAVPSHGRPGTEGLRTMPPRENGGNFDVKQLTKGAKLLLPVSVEGALFSTGDGHFAQGDGEVCVMAVEIGATAALRFRVVKDAPAARSMRGPRFSHPGYFAPPEWAAPRGFVAAMGMPITDEGVNDGENLTLACRNALLNMLDLLQERGWTREQAYILCSVACDLRVSNVVDVPNYVVSALLPEAIFEA